ncbi:MAG: PIN domain-containing protein [Deltaproteobacteria bacterium]|nr:PIN domain-containing protein [Deltaproteobacteria bacterium]
MSIVRLSSRRSLWQKAQKSKKHKIELITSEYVIDESITLIRYRVSHYAAVIFGDALFNSSIVKITDVQDEDRLKAWEIFKKYEDKELSFTDCASFAIMEKLKLHKAFTFDEHFKKAGFEVF